MISEITQRKSNNVWYHLYVGSKKLKQSSEYNKKETHRYRKQWLQLGEGNGEGQDRSRGLRGTNRYKKVIRKYYCTTQGI